jgi:phenylalanyl-tRNA synthetase beta chain
MLTPVNWLKKYVEIENIDIKKLSDDLIMSGSNIETVEKVGEGIEKVVVGKILEIQGHPDADKLLVMKVDIGSEILQIVTGAQNCSLNDYVPVALVGAKLPDLKIKKGKLRGVESFGMFCSFEELGFEKSVIPKEFADGILILDKEYPLGMDIFEALDLYDNVIEFEITPNRPDCLSMIGMARETAATFDLELKMPELKAFEGVEDIKDYIEVEIEDYAKCPRYMAGMIKDVKIEASPMWMQTALMKAGVRPINNIVDITNYVMLEFGQPIHAFDYDRLEAKKIIVRNPMDNEKFVTLDDVERTLKESHLVIADGEKAVALAGIMGGQNTEVSDTTVNVLMEVANFNKSLIREASKELGHRTEASSRFEKGIDPNTAELAMARIFQLVEELAAGTIVKGVVDAKASDKEKVEIKFRPERIRGLIGVELSDEEIVKILNRLYIEVKNEDGQYTAYAPTYRLDLLKEIDLVEEVARIYGYNVIEPTLSKDSAWGGRTNGQQIEDLARESLISLGLNEITTYSFISPKAVDKLNINEESLLRNVIRLRNPLGEEYSAMRTTLLSNMLDVLARNYKRKVESASAYEIGNLFFPKEVPVKTLPIEKKSLCMGMYGKDVDFYTIKGIVERLLEAMGIKEYKFITEENNKTFHPGRCATVLYKDHVIGTIGEIHPLVAENFEIDSRVYCGELDFNIMLQITRRDSIYKSLPKYPAVLRDIAVVIDEDVASQSIIDIIEDNGGKLLEKVDFFDMYKGSQIEKGKKSMAYSLSFRASDRTLTDEDINKIFDKIVNKLEEGLGAQLR